MLPPFPVHRAVPGDAPAIARLTIREVCRHVRADCSEQGFLRLLGELAARRVEERLQGEFRYWVARDAGGIAGVCALRAESHLYHLFVASRWQGLGIGRCLWETARDDVLSRLPHVASFTVYASTFARPFYLRQGFRPDGAANVQNGIRSWPMSLAVR